MKHFLSNVARRMLGLCLALIVWGWRASCRIRIAADDPRPQLRQAKRPYVYALLHAQQVAAIFCSDERALGAMVSRSQDGDLLVPSLRLRGITPVRGSSRRGGIDKGGMTALKALGTMARQGIPVMLAVDGPRGPRNRVHRGAAHLALQVGGVVVPVAALPSRRWMLRRTWDRMQLPKPFSRITLHFAAPIDPALTAERGDDARAAIEHALRALEARLDPHEAAVAPRP